MKKSLSLVIALVLALSSLFSLSASAATTGGANEQTIYVETKANWLIPGSESITLKQNEATYRYTDFGWGGFTTKTASIYPTYKITLKNINTGKITTKTWKDSTIKLNLDRNCCYNITVSYDSQSTILRTNFELDDYKTAPSWYVSKTHKVVVCY